MGHRAHEMPGLAPVCAYPAAHWQTALLAAPHAVSVVAPAMEEQFEQVVQVPASGVTE